MAKPFDPYHRWLGIPPEEQPPHHYRLLGIRPLEDDREVIDTAADRQMLLLRMFQAGEHAGLCHKLLNEVAAARVCLTNPHKKAAYDAQLVQQWQAQVAPPVVSEAASTAAQPPTPFDALVPDAGGQTSLWRSPLLGRSNRRLLLLGIAAVVLLAGLALVFLLVLRGGGPAPEAETRLIIKWLPGGQPPATLSIDGRAVPVPASGRIEWPCQPGRHQVVVAQPGFAPIRKTVTVDRGDTVTISFSTQELPARAGP